MEKGGSVSVSDRRSRRASEPPLTPDELHRLRWGLGGVLALWSAWGSYVFDLSGAALLVPITLAVGAVLAWPALPARTPSWVGRLAFPGLALFLAADVVLNGEPLAAMVRLNLLLIAVRACSVRRPREDLQLLVLCLFIVVVAGVLTVAIGFVVHILVFTALALANLVVITLSGAGDAGTDGWAQMTWGRLFGRLRRAVDWRIVAGAAALNLLVVAMATVLFVAMPRFQIENSLGFLQLSNKRSLSGFSGTVQLGDVTDIAEDTSTVLRAEIDSPGQVPADLYWRMVALDDYQAGTFRASRGLARYEQRTSVVREWAGTRAEVPGEPVWTFYYEPGVSRFLPLTGEFARIRLREPRALVVNPKAGTLALRDEPQAMFAYRIAGLDLAGGRTDPVLGAALEARRMSNASDYPATLLAVPDSPGDLAVLDRIVREIHGGERLAPATFINRASAWLAKNHAYSRRSKIPAGPEDVLVRWLRSGEPGHCELFAGGFVLLARRAGFPARVLTGFKGGTWNEFERYYMIRNSDAHAWCEIYDEHGRWLRVDPTPGGGSFGDAAGGRAATAVDRSWTARLDALRMLWYRRVVDFDQGAQVEMADSLRVSARDLALRWIRRLDQWGREVLGWLQRPWGATRIASSGVLAVVAVVLAWVLVRWRYLWWRRWQRTDRGGDPVRREAGRWLRRFERAGCPASPDAPLADLQRLRYGRPSKATAAWPVFLAAKRAWARRRRPGIQ